MTTEESKNFKAISGPIDLIAYIFRYRMKELLILVTILLSGYIIASNLSYDSKTKEFKWQPSIKVDVRLDKK